MPRAIPAHQTIIPGRSIGVIQSGMALTHDGLGSSKEYIDSYVATKQYIHDPVDDDQVIQYVKGGLKENGDIELPAYDNSYTPYDRSRAYATMVQINPIGGNLTFGKSTTRVTFEIPDWQRYTTDTQDMIITETIAPDIEFLTIPPDDLFWDEILKEPISNAEAPGILISKGSWTITRHYCRPSEVANGFIPWIGTVNKDALYSPKYGMIFYPETLLFGTPEIIRQRSGYGVHFDVTFSLKWYIPEHEWVDVVPYGWNVFKHNRYLDPQPMWHDLGDMGPGVHAEYVRPYVPKSWDSWLPLFENPDEED